MKYSIFNCLKKIKKILLSFADSPYLSFWLGFKHTGCQTIYTVSKNRKYFANYWNYKGINTLDKFKKNHFKSMGKLLFKNHKIIFSVIIITMHFIGVDLTIHTATAQVPSENTFEGEYSGQIFIEDGNEAIEAGLKVTALGNNEYEGILYYGGLPEERNDPVGDDDIIELKGTYHDFVLRLSGEEIPLHFQFILGRFTALDEQNNYMGHLEKVIRVSPQS